ncbi:hypothetical protein L195_g007480 [Trifolium pratense]|uniref:Uncharacterized protein n=1 Tax=Trifolium pratense TaxID=57577 RepID=A0A2K3P6H6_TRIPR|nr:hypothetical protein L195_g007480 [Trifolium pratense]
MAFDSSTLLLLNLCYFVTSLGQVLQQLSITDRVCSSLILVASVANHIVAVEEQSWSGHNTVSRTVGWGGWVPTYGHTKETQRLLGGDRRRPGRGVGAEERKKEEGRKRKKSSKGGLLLNLVELQHPTAMKRGPLWTAYSGNL